MIWDDVPESNSQVSLSALRACSVISSSSMAENDHSSMASFDWSVNLSFWPDLDLFLSELSFFSFDWHSVEMWPFFPHLKHLMFGFLFFLNFPLFLAARAVSSFVDLILLYCFNIWAIDLEESPIDVVSIPAIKLFQDSGSEVSKLIANSASSRVCPSPINSSQYVISILM